MVFREAKTSTVCELEYWRKGAIQAKREKKRAERKGKGWEGKGWERALEICRGVPLNLWLIIDFYMHESKLPNSKGEKYWKGVERPVGMGIVVVPPTRVERTHDIGDK